MSLLPGNSGGFVKKAMMELCDELTSRPTEVEEGKQRSHGLNVKWLM